MVQIEDMHDFLDLFQGPEIDDMEAALAKLGYVEQALALNRLSIDAMIDYHTLKISGYDAESGPSTAQISQRHEAVTLERLGLLDQIRPLLPKDETLKIFCDALGQLRSKMPASAPAGNPSSFDM